MPRQLRTWQVGHLGSGTAATRLTAAAHAMRRRMLLQPRQLAAQSLVEAVLQGRRAHS